MLTLTVSFTELPVSPAEVRVRALEWAQQFQYIANYESAPVAYPNGGFRNILAVSNTALLPETAQLAFNYLDVLLQEQKLDQCPLFGHVIYELKDELEDLASHHKIRFGWPRMQFFRPQAYLEWKAEELVVISNIEPPAEILKQILAYEQSAANPSSGVPLQPRISRSHYLETVQKLRLLIEEGDVYEINFCQELYAEHIQLNPLQVYRKLQSRSPVPFGTFYKSDHRYLMGASPERFLKQNGSQLLSQPIKGTAPRGQNPEADAVALQGLLSSEKERAENMMIVDLVRNDLSRVCTAGSITVPELFGIYPFRQVHQMISTIAGTLQLEKSIADAFRALFPMGSMTGAPKVSAMQLIEQYESSRRELFSGSVGYIFPDGTADWNVNIRSLQYNSQTGYLNALVGSAITWDSEPEAEYAECLVKAQAMNEALA